MSEKFRGFFYYSEISLTGYHSKDKIKASVHVRKAIKLGMYTLLFYEDLDGLPWTAQ